MGNSSERSNRRPRRRSENSSASDIRKQSWPPGTILFPLPVVLISSVDANGKPNMCTVAWTGIVCSSPPLLSISLRKERYSYSLIWDSKEFVVNIPSARQLRATDYCGIVSGRDVDKFNETGLTTAPASQLRTPLIRECPINLECQVRETLDLGSHTMFISEIVAVNVNEDQISPSGRLALEKTSWIVFAHGGYYILGKKKGFFGFSVKKRKDKSE